MFQIWTDPKTPTGPCALCGTETTHGDSLVVNTEREHYSCRKTARQAMIREFEAKRAFLSVARIMYDWAPLLGRRLESRADPLVEQGTPAALCRLITFILKEAEQSPELNQIRREALRTLLGQIRASFLSAGN